MAILPENALNVDLSQNIAWSEWDTNTWYVNPVTKSITGMCDGLTAMQQAVEIILNIERFYWQIYTPNFGMQWEGLIGNSPAYVAAVMLRRLADAFSVDNRITGITNYTYTVDEGVMTVNLVIGTVYGNIMRTFDINLN